MINAQSRSAVQDRSLPKAIFGRTAVELLALCFIVPIIAYAAISMGRHYMSRSLASSAYRDLMVGVAGAEAQLAKGNDVLLAEQVGIADSSSSCAAIYVSVISSSRHASLDCEIRERGYLPDVGTRVQIERSQDGTWTCQSDSPSRYLPADCASTEQS